MEQTTLVETCHLYLPVSLIKFSVPRLFTKYIIYPGVPRVRRFGYFLSLDVPVLRVHSSLPRKEGSKEGPFLNDSRTPRLLHTRRTEGDTVSGGTVIPSEVYIDRDG